MGKSAEVDPKLMHVPPSQQSAQGPVPKGGEPLVPKERPRTDLPVTATQSVPKSENLTRKDLELMTKNELGDYAEERDIEVNSHWSKDEIIDAIVKGQRKK